VLRTIVLTTTLGVALTGGGGAPPSATLDDRAPFGASDPPNPLAVYSRRPGAQYGDVEAPIGTPVTIQGARLTLRSATIVPGPVPPAPPAPEVAGLAALLAPRAFDPLLHESAETGLRVHVDSDIAGDLGCTLTAGSDGAVAARVATPAHDGRAELTFPIGGRRGRFYLACAPTTGLVVAAFTGSGVDRAVWGFDV
jgi:hypothetical protein